MPDKADMIAIALLFLALPLIDLIKTKLEVRKTRREYEELNVKSANDQSEKRRGR
jgi:hypothetical protein